MSNFAKAKNILFLSIAVFSLVVVLTANKNTVNTSKQAAMSFLNPKVTLASATAPTQTQTIQLYTGWNYISFNIEPLDQNGNPIYSVKDVLMSINGQYAAVQSFDRGAKSYYPDLPESMNDLKTMLPQFGYSIKVPQNVVLTINGKQTKANQPISLQAGWNNIGYLPNMAINTKFALYSIRDKYEKIYTFNPKDGAKVYYNDLPWSFNDLTCMRPGQGYWIKMKEAAALIYPLTGNCSATLPTSDSYYQDTNGITMSNFWADFVIDTAFKIRLKTGDVIEAVDNNNIVCGRAVINKLTKTVQIHVYGDDATTPADEGAKNDEPITFRLNGNTISLTGYSVWNEQAYRTLTVN